MKEIGDVIRRYRKGAKLSQVELGKLLSVDQTHISKIEQGERMPSVELLSQIVRLLHIPASELMDSGDADAIPLADLSQDDWEHEKELAEIVRGLNLQRKQKVLTYAQEQYKLMTLRRGRVLQAD